MKTHIIPFFFVIATTILVSKTYVNSESCKCQECDVTETVPLIDDQKAPLAVSIDMSNVNKRVMQFIEEAIETKMSNLTKTKLEDVLASLKLEKALRKYIEDLQDNLIINITTDIQGIVQEQIKLSSNQIRKGEVALSICTAGSSGHIEAVMRTYCDGIPNGTCNEICKRRDKRLRCADVVHVYNRYSQNYASTHRYGKGGCFHKTCGPNFCCCIR